MVEPFAVRRDQDRFAHPVNFLNGRFDIKVSGRDTGGALLMIDTVRLGRGGPPLHLHHHQDEFFIVEEGTFRVRIGALDYDLEPGDFAFGPRGVPHAFVNLSETGRLLVGFQPAGTMEAFFSHPMTDPRSEAFRTLSEEHGMRVVGPPLSP